MIKLTEISNVSPFPALKSRLPIWVFPKEILGSKDYLTEVEAGLEKLKDKPVLIILGEIDGTFRKPNRLLLMKYFPNHKVCLLPKAKHFIQENAPEEICSAIKEFLP